jgi:hypothetical protein
MEGQRINEWDRTGSSDELHVSTWNGGRDDNQIVGPGREAKEIP